MHIAGRLFGSITRKARNVAESEEGGGYVEFLITLPLFMLLVLLVWSFALYWWMQVSAATAIHDGVRVAAQGGTIVQGRTRAYERLEAALGKLAEPIEEKLYIIRLPALRSVRGGVEYTYHSPLRYFGFPGFQVKATSFQREERFYGGRPGKWE